MGKSAECARVSIVDDHRVFAEAVMLALKVSGDFQAVSVSADAPSGLAAIIEHEPDLAIIDYRLAGVASGIDLSEEIRSADLRTNGKPLPILLLTGYPAPLLFRAIGQIQSATVLSKASSMTTLITEVRRCIGEGPGIPMVVDDPFGLSPAEFEVLEYLSAGRNADQIARVLCLSIHAIRARIKGLLRKLGVASQLEAVARAMSYGLVVPPGLLGVSGPFAEQECAEAPGPISVTSN